MPLLEKRGLKGKLYVGQVVMASALTTFFEVVSPLKRLTYYRRYFSTCRAISLKETEIHHCFAALFLLLAYVASAQMTFICLFYFSPASSEWISQFAIQLLLANWFTAIDSGHQFFCFISVFLAAFTAYLHWELYYRDNRVLNALFEKTLFGSTTATLNGEKTKVLIINNSISRAQFQRLILATTNGVGLIFIVLLDACFLAFFVLFARHLFHQQPDQLWLLGGKHFYEASQPVLFRLFNLFALLLLLLFFQLLFFGYWTSYAHALFLIVNYSIVCLVFLYLHFERHYRHLKKILRRCLRLNRRKKRPSFDHSLHRHHYHHHINLERCLQRNLQLFQLIFLTDIFWRPLITAFMASQLPLSSYYIMELVLHRVGNVLLYGGLFSLSAQALIGNFAIHLCIARLNGYIHRGGKMMASFTAFNNKSENRSKNFPLPPRLSLSVHHHISRLLVHKKYGLTYGGLGTPLSMKSFTKCLLLYGEFLMYAYTFLQNG